MSGSGILRYKGPRNNGRLCLEIPPCCQHIIASWPVSLRIGRCWDVDIQAHSREIRQNQSKNTGFRHGFNQFDSTLVSTIFFKVVLFKVNRRDSRDFLAFFRYFLLKPLFTRSPRN